MSLLTRWDKLEAALRGRDGGAAAPEVGGWNPFLGIPRPPTSVQCCTRVNRLARITSLLGQFPKDQQVGFDELFRLVSRR
jgi:hypothetical protein